MVTPSFLRTTPALFCAALLQLCSAHALQVQPEVVAQGLQHPWAVAFLPDGKFLVTERPGRMRAITPDGTLGAPIQGLPAIAVGGQGGLLDVVLAALAKDECFCPNREIIRLVLTRTYVQNRCELCETEEIRSKLMKGFCTWEKKNGLSRKNEIRRRGISFFYGAILRMLSKVNGKQE